MKKEKIDMINNVYVIDRKPLEHMKEIEKKIMSKVLSGEYILIKEKIINGYRYSYIKNENYGEK